MAIKGYDDDGKTRYIVLIVLIGGIIAGYGLDRFINGWTDTSRMYIIGIPGNVGVGQVSKVTFITFDSSEAIGNVNITLDGAASGRGTTDTNGRLELSINATTNGSINVTAEKAGYRNATSIIMATPGLIISATPGSITSGTASFVTFSVSGLGKPVDGAALGLSGAGISVDGVTNSNGTIILQLNPSNTGAITAVAKKTGYSDGSTTITSASQQTLSVSSSQSSVTVNVPVFVTITVTAGGSAVNDAVVTLSGAASGTGITNQDGKAIISFTSTSTGTITASASKAGYAGGSATITSASTQALAIASSPTSVTAGVPTYVMFTVTSGSIAVSESTVTLTGAASGNGVTNQNGQVIIQVNSTGTGTITASATKNGFSGTTTTLTAVGQPTLGVSASPSNITNGVATYVTFTVTSGGSAVSGATVSVSGGGITADAITNSQGLATLQLNAAASGTISVTARKTGYIDGTTTIAH
ncbi:Uncharacterised protein [uncultured archaeon]|nr:Uncharacterised protein [uncultured archaeon]